MSGGTDASTITAEIEPSVLPGDSPIARSFRLVQVVVAARESLGVRELARRSGLPRSTVSRLVATLTDLEMLERTGDGSVLPGPGLATLQPDAGASPLSVRLRPLLAELVSTFGEHAALSVDDTDRLLYVAQVSSEHPVSVPDVSGERHHFHLVAPGLMTMASWGDERLADYLAGDLAAPTPQSLTTTATLRGRLREIAGTGWCWTDQELDVGVNGLAVPIMIDGALAATVSLFGPAYRFNQAALPEAGAALRRIVTERIAGLMP
ncbi:MAG: IclR family transcriptional regulator [Actinomycetota bacterium]